MALVLTMLSNFLCYLVYDCALGVHCGRGPKDLKGGLVLEIFLIPHLRVFSQYLSFVLLNQWIALL